MARGLYWDPIGAPVTENHDLATVAAAIPKAVICLFSALQFHELTNEWPREIWIALDRQSRVSPSLKLPLRVHLFSKAILEFGIEEHCIEGVIVRKQVRPKPSQTAFVFETVTART